jgi:hypothetical protein
MVESLYNSSSNTRVICRIIIAVTIFIKSRGLAAIIKVLRLNCMFVGHCSSDNV